MTPFGLQLFQVWSRMTLYKKAVREEREPPTFLPENGYASLPEWDAWVANKGRHLEMKRKVIHIGGQVRGMGYKCPGSAAVNWLWDEQRRCRVCETRSFSS